MIYVLKSKGISSPMMMEAGRQRHSMLFSVIPAPTWKQAASQAAWREWAMEPRPRGIHLVPCGYFWATITDEVSSEWRENYGVIKCSGRDLLEPVFKQGSLRNHILKPEFWKNQVTLPPPCQDMQIPI